MSDSVSACECPRVSVAVGARARVSVQVRARRLRVLHYILYYTIDIQYVVVDGHH